MRKTLITLVSAATLTLPLLAIADDEATSNPERKGPRGERAGERGPRGIGLGPEFASMSAEDRLAIIKKRIEEHPRIAEMLTRRFDKNRNGELSDTELAAAAEAIAKRDGKLRAPRGEARGEGEGKRNGTGEGRNLGKRPARDAAE